MSEYGEPWSIADDGFFGGINRHCAEPPCKYLDCKEGRPQLHPVFGGEPHEGRIEPNDRYALRAIACVNACAGIADDDLVELANLVANRGG